MLVRSFRSLMLLGATVALAACSADDGRPSGAIAAPATASDAGDGDAGQGTGGDAGGGGKKKNAEGPCSSGSECESGFCFVGGNQSYCAVPCTADTGPTVCVAPFTGSCNKQGYCKRD